MVNMKRVAVLTSVIALALTAFPAARAEETGALDRPDPKWHRGPVKYILQKAEASRYKKLKTEEDRAAFITEFWKRRDPTPETEANEFKERYAARLTTATATFAAPNGRGWDEDRAKVFLLLGPPDQIEMRGGGGGGESSSAPGATTSPGGEPGASSAAGPRSRRRATLLYAEEIFPGGPTPAQLEFVEDSSGGFRLVTKVDLSDPRLTGLEPLPVLIAAAPPPSPEAPPVEPEPPPPPPPTPGEELMEEVLGDPPPESQVDLLTRLDFYKTREAETFATLTVALERPEGAGTDLVVAARLLDESDEVAVSLEKERSFTAGGSEDLYQAAHNMPPGDYHLLTAVKDPSSGMVGYRRDEVEIPDFKPEGLQISTVTLAREVERVSTPPAPNTRFVLGNFKVFPSPSPVFRAGQELILYYQIYNTATDPESGQPELKVSYMFEKVEARRKIPLGREPIAQNVTSAVQIYGITIAPVWPKGDYQVTVKVEDLVSASTISSVVTFQVEKEN
jgi:GWxTD domain-containing protein